MQFRVSVLGAKHHLVGAAPARERVGDVELFPAVGDTAPLLLSSQPGAVLVFSGLG